MSLGRAFEHNFGPEDGNLKELIQGFKYPVGGKGVEVSNWSTHKHEICLSAYSSQNEIEFRFSKEHQRRSGFMSRVYRKLTIGSYVSVRSSRYEARGKFGEHERCVRVARGVAESNSSV